MNKKIRYIFCFILCVTIIIISNVIIYGETEEDTSIYNSGVSDGNYVGVKAGEEFAKSDYINNDSYNTDIAYSSFIDESNFISDYETYYLPSSYYMGFLQGVKTGFYNSYELTYLQMQSEKVENSKFMQLPTKGDLTTDYIIELNSDNLDVSFSMDFGYSNFFDNSFIKVYDKGRFWNYNANKFTPYSNLYSVEVYNESNGTKENFIELKKPMKISFTHSLGENVGIYQVVNNKLKYLHTVVDEERGDNVYTYLPKGKYYGGTYVLLADENLREAKDIKSNWNYSGLETYARRGWLPLNSYGNANPKSSITRAELAYMIEQNFNTENEVFEKTVDYVDNNKFFGYDNAINYCVSKGYLTVTNDNRFRPLDNVSYAEMEIVLGRLGCTIPFSTIDNEMINSYHMSNYKDSEKNPITVSEAVFVLLYAFK